MSKAIDKNQNTETQEPVDKTEEQEVVQSYAGGNGKSR